MARIYQPTYKARNGRTRGLSRYYVECKHAGRTWRIAGFVDKGATVELGRQIDRLAALHAVGERPDPALAHTIERWPASLRARVAKVGLLEASHAAGLRPLADLLEDFKAHLRGRDRTAKHVAHVVGRAKALIEGCGFRTWTDIQAPAVERHLRALREDRPGEGEEVVRGMAVKTSNHLLASLRQFCRWAVESGLASEDPLRTARTLNARVDPRRERRALGDDELLKLIEATRRGPILYGLTGPERALLYTLAAETGLRANELRSLRVASFDLDPERPRVTLHAAASKHRQEDVLPLRPDTARALAGHLGGRKPWDPAFPVTRGWRPPRMLRTDLKAADLDYEDDAKRVFDFHCFRVQFVSGLIRAGVDARTVQRMARHSTPNLTLAVYAKLMPDAEARALDKLPSLAERDPRRPSGVEHRATGTDGCMASGMASGMASNRTELHSTAGSTPRGNPENPMKQGVNGGGGGSRTRVPEGTGPEHLRA
jgi:integrase